MAAITLDSVVARSDDIVVGTVDADVMMMSIESGKYYQLNISASRIWNILEQPMPVAELCEMLSKDFKVTPDACQKDVMRFLDELATKKIILVK